MQGEFWSDIGRGSGGGGTSGRFLPTPNAMDGMKPRSMEALRRAKKKGGCSNLKDRITDGTLTSFVLASPARTSATQEKVRGLAENAADYSGKPCVSFAYWDQSTCCWKTLMPCLFADYQKYSGRWPRSGTMRNGIAYQLPPLVPRISGTGSLSWPTPSVCGFSNQGQGMKIAQVADSYEEAVAMTDGRKSVIDPYYPTPTARDWKSGKGKTQKDRGRTSGPSLAEACGGKLNPQFVEYLMGFPKNWTEVD